MTTQTETKTPALIAYAVDENGSTGKSYFTRIGAAWAHGKSGGMTVLLQALPVDGKVVLLPPKADDNGDA